jgi:quinol monooxygenase YgiN
MFIALVEFLVAPADRPAALQVLLDEAPGVRALPGNSRFLPFADPSAQDRIVIYHEWQDEAGFRGYASSPAFARSGAALRPLMTGAPLSRRFRADLAEAVA